MREGSGGGWWGVGEEDWVGGGKGCSDDSVLVTVLNRVFFWSTKGLNRGFCLYYVCVRCVKEDGISYATVSRFSSLI